MSGWGAEKKLPAHYLRSTCHWFGYGSVASKETLVRPNPVSLSQPSGTKAQESALEPQERLKAGQLGNP